MDRNNYDGICAFMAGLWGRELSNVQRAAGWKMLAALPNEAVEKAVSAVADDGQPHMPAWPVIYKAAQGIAHAERESQHALPAGDALSDAEHVGAMVLLRSRLTPEQRRRADRVTAETKGLPMKVRLIVARDMLQTYARVDPASWNRLLDETLAREFQLVQPLLSQGRGLHDD